MDVIELDRRVAEVVLGARSGRPTISARAGGVVSGLIGVSPEVGTDLFHAALIIGGVYWLANRK